MYVQSRDKRRVLPGTSCHSCCNFRIYRCIVKPTLTSSVKHLASPMLLLSLFRASRFRASTPVNVQPALRGNLPELDKICLCMFPCCISPLQLQDDKETGYAGSSFWTTVSRCLAPQRNPLCSVEERRNALGLQAGARTCGHLP